jgi:hypothetical protein
MRCSFKGDEKFWVDFINQFNKIRIKIISCNIPSRSEHKWKKIACSAALLFSASFLVLSIASSRSYSVLASLVNVLYFLCAFPSC